MSDDWRELLDRLLDGETLTDAEYRELSDALADDANRREAADAMRFYARLASELSPEWSASREQLLAVAALEEKRVEPRRRVLRAWLAAAAVLLVAAGAAWLFLVPRYPSPQFAGDCRVTGQHVVAGSKGARVELGGYVDVALDPGTDIVLGGSPGNESVKLNQGTARSKIVPHKGHYRVETPLGSLDVVGTEFTTTVEHVEPPAEAAAPAAPAAPAADPKIVTEAYDIRDLIAPIPNFKAPESVWAPAEEKQPQPAADKTYDARRKALTDELVATIIDAVDQGSWQPNGVGAVRIHEGNLLVTQTAANQTVIEELIHRLYRNRSLQAVIEAQFIEIPAARETELHDWMAKELKRPLDDQTGQALLSGEDAKALLEQCRSAAQIHMLTAPRLTLLNTQRAYVTVVSEARTLLLKNMARPNETVPMTLKQGCCLDVRATVSDDLKGMAMTLGPSSGKLLTDGPEPLFSIAESVVTANVQDGMTLVLRMPVVEKKALGVNEVKDRGDGAPTWQVSAAPTDKTRRPEAYVYLLVTGRIIDGQPLDEHLLFPLLRLPAAAEGAAPGPALPEVVPPLTDEQRRQAEALIAQFSAPEFAVRQKAVEDLVKMKRGVLPLVQKTLADTKDAEVKLRCQMVLKGLGKAASGGGAQGKAFLTTALPEPKPAETLAPKLVNEKPVFSDGRDYPLAMRLVDDDRKMVWIKGLPPRGGNGIGLLHYVLRDLATGKDTDLPILDVPFDPKIGPGIFYSVIGPRMSSPDGRTLVLTTGDDLNGDGVYDPREGLGKIILYDVETGKVKPLDITFNDKEMPVAGFDRTGKLLFISTCNFGDWSHRYLVCPMDKPALKKLSFEGEVCAVNPADDATVFLQFEQGKGWTWLLYDIVKAKCIAEILKRPLGQPWCGEGAWTPDGRYLYLGVSTQNDPNEGPGAGHWTRAVHVWDRTTKKETSVVEGFTLGGPGPIPGTMVLHADDEQQAGIALHAASSNRLYELADQTVSFRTVGKRHVVYERRDENAAGKPPIAIYIAEIDPGNAGAPAAAPPRADDHELRQEAGVVVKVTVQSGVVAFNFDGVTGQLAAGETREFGAPVVAAATPEPAPENAGPAGVAWGKEVAGLQLGLAYDGEERTYHLRETVTFKLLLRNVGDKPAKLMDSVPPGGLVPAVVDALGKDVPIGRVEIWFEVPPRWSECAPGATIEIAAVSLQLLAAPGAEGPKAGAYAFLKPGAYRVSRTHDFLGDPKATWFGALTTGALTLTVEAPAEARGIGTPKADKDGTLMLYDFENGQDTDGWGTAAVEMSVSDQHATSGKHSLKVAIQKADVYAGFAPSMPANWSKYAAIKMDIWCDEDMELCFRADDVNSRGYPTRYNLDGQVMHKGPNTVTIPIADVAARVDVSQITFFSCFIGQKMVKAEGEYVIYLDNIRMVKEDPFDPVGKVALLPPRMLPWAKKDRDGAFLLYDFEKPEQLAGWQLHRSAEVSGSSEHPSGGQGSLKVTFKADAAPEVDPVVPESWKGYRALEFQTWCEGATDLIVRVTDAKTTPANHKFYEEKFQLLDGPNTVTVDLDAVAAHVDLDHVQHLVLWRRNVAKDGVIYIDDVRLLP